MKVNLKPLALAALLATSALTVLAQPAGGPPPEGKPGMHQPDPERRAHMQERMKDRAGQRAAELKASLKLSPEQEAGWNAYVQAMKPAESRPMPKRDDDAKLSTPERLDQMRAMRQKHEAEFDKRDAATRSFYGTLNAEQKKTFDTRTARRMHDEEGRRHPGPR